MSEDFASTPFPAPILYLHADGEAWCEAAADDIAAALRHQLETREQARLLLSGGSTPAPVYRLLAQAWLDWSRISVGLVDERWLPEGDPASNARLIRDNLLEEGAVGARFEPMLMPPHSIEESLHAANRADGDGAVAVLGMGEDGHIASLFPGAADLAPALASRADYVAIDASAAPGAAPWPQRISLTPAGLARTSARVLLLRGERKRELLWHALEPGDPQELPVRVALALPGAPLRIHWCP